MPFLWKSNNKRCKVSPTKMKSAVLLVTEKSKSIRAVATEYGIDRKTLGRYVDKYKKSEDGKIEFKANHVSCQVFSNEEEHVLKAYLLHASKLNYGLTSKATRNLAYQYAAANNKVIPENWTLNKTASYDWLKGFFHRHANLSLRQPESTSLSRATAFNKTTVREFFNNLHCILEKKKFGPEAIFNVDETGITTVHKSRKIIAMKGEKQVSQVTSAERGTLVTMCCGISAIGTSIPPFLVFPRVHVKEIMTRGGPLGMQAAAHPSGWMTAENFQLYLHHFIKFSKCSKDKEVLIILDNHESHISVKGLQLCKDHGITLLTLPPHTSHKLQPLDKTVFSPFKMFYNSAASDFMIMHPGKPITIYDIPHLVGRSFSKAFTPENIQSGFACTGIWPLNSDIFSESDFLPSNVTDRSDPDVMNSSASSKPSTSINNLPPASPYPSTSASVTNLPDSSESTQILVTPEQLRPFPKAEPRKGRGGRKRIKSRILTDTPVKTEIEERHNSKNIKLTTRNIKKSAKKQEKKRKIALSSDSENESQNFHVSSNEDGDDFKDSTTSIEVGDFVLAKFTTKSSFVHYIGCVTKENGDDLTLNFLRRSDPCSFSFIYPQIEDVATVSQGDIIKLPHPNISGGTERVALKIKFDCDISKYQNLY
ncbi:uncharacterized protein [Parasteatoda tepidariorum]|nr:uncharacterized protein LOC107442021 [Parasteatoda tepidariorum]